MSFLGRDLLTAGRTVKTEEVTTDLGTILVRVLTGTERERMENSINADKSPTFRARVVAATACDQDGKLLFADSDVKELGELSWEILDTISKAALKLNGVGKDDVDAAEKN